MKLGVLDLDHLRRGLRTHSRLAGQVAGLDLDQRREKELMALATELGSDARALIDAVREQDHEAVEYSSRYPAFEGRLEFDLTIEVLGKRVTRRARADYKYTPDWEYFDLRKRAPYVGWAQSMPGITVRTFPSKDGTGGGPAREEADILSIG